MIQRTADDDNELKSEPQLGLSSEANEYNIGVHRNLYDHFLSNEGGSKLLVLVFVIPWANNFLLFNHEDLK